MTKTKTAQKWEIMFFKFKFNDETKHEWRRSSENNGMKGEHDNDDDVR